MKTPYGAPSPGGAVTWKPGYAASASSTAAPLNARPIAFGVWIPHDAVQQGARLLLGVGVGVGRYAPASRDRVRSRPSCSRDERCLGLDVEPVSTNTTSLRKPPSVVRPTLSVGGGGSPRTPEIRTRSGPPASSDDRVEAGRDVGAGVARPGDLVEQLGGDRAAVTAPPVPGCLVMTHEPSASISASGKPGRRRSPISVKNEKLPPVAWAPHSRTCPATVAAGERVVVVASPAEVRSRRADDERRVGDPAGDDDVGAGPRQAAMPHAPR